MTTYQSNELDLATNAAKADDVQGMLEHLYASRLLDGMKRLLMQKYPALGSGVVEECISDSVVKAYEQIKRGKLVGKLAGYIYKGAEHNAIDIVRTPDFKLRSAVDLERLAYSSSERSTNSEREDRTAAAIGLARGYLPRLGDGHIVTVMTVVIDAVEAGVTDLPASEISKITGVSEDSVRTLLSRGFRRLQALAEDDGLHVDDAVVQEFLVFALDDASDYRNDDPDGVGKTILDR